MEYYSLVNVDSITVKQGVILYHKKLKLKPSFSPNTIYRVQRSVDLEENRVDFCLSQEDILNLINHHLAFPVEIMKSSTLEDIAPVELTDLTNKVDVPEITTKDYIPPQTSNPVPFKKYDKNRRRQK